MSVVFYALWVKFVVEPVAPLELMGIFVLYVVSLGLGNFVKVTWNVEFFLGSSCLIILLSFGVEPFLSDFFGNDCLQV